MNTLHFKYAVEIEKTAICRQRANAFLDPGTTAVVEVDKAVADSIVQQDQDTSTHSTGYQPSSEPSYVGPIVNDGPGIAEYPDPPF